VAYWWATRAHHAHLDRQPPLPTAQQYYYAVCAYDYGYDPGPDADAIYPSENAITVSRTTPRRPDPAHHVVRRGPNPKWPDTRRRRRGGQPRGAGVWDGER